MKPEATTHASPALAPGSGSGPAGADVSGEPFISKQELARRLGRTTRTVDNLMRDGLIPFYKFDRHVSFRWHEVVACLARRCRVEANPNPGVDHATQPNS